MSAIFIKLSDYIKGVQQDSANWRAVLKPGIRLRVTPSGNTRVRATPDKKAILDTNGNRTYTAKDSSKVYDATFTKFRPPTGGDEVVELTYNISTIETDDETGEENEVIKPITDITAWNADKYYVDPTSLQTGARRRGHTLRRRRTGKTRRGRKH